MFDLPRLEALLAEGMARFDANLDKVADHVMDTVNAYASRRDDDRTLLLVRRHLAPADASV